MTMTFGGRMTVKRWEDQRQDRGSPHECDVLHCFPHFWNGDLGTGTRRAASFSQSLLLDAGCTQSPAKI